MRKALRLFIFYVALLFFTAGQGFCADDMMDFDYEFLDNAFTNPNPTTNKQFEDVMKQYENREPTGIFYKMKKFFNRNNPEYDKNFKKQYENPNNQPARIKDEPESKPTVTIGSNFYDSNGKVSAAGHYQVDYKKGYLGDEKLYTISLMQGETRIAEVKAIPYEDDWETPAVVYCRTENVSSSLVRVIYANLDLTLLGYIRLTND